MSKGKTLLEVIAEQHGPDFVPPCTYTKQHYKDMAEMMVHSDDRGTGEWTERGFLWCGIVENFVVIFTTDNPEFNEDKFKAACGW